MNTNNNNDNLDEMEVDHNILELMEIDVGDVITNPCDDYVYVDVQGFKTYQERFICKEFCLVDGDYKFHAIVKSPYSFHKMPYKYQRQAHWLIKHHHGIKYEDGDIIAMDLKTEIFPKLMNKTILVKGNEKVDWLKNMFRHFGEIRCINIEKMGFDLTVEQSEPFEICSYHKKIPKWKQCTCAMSTALLLQDLAYKNDFMTIL